MERSTDRDRSPTCTRRKSSGYGATSFRTPLGARLAEAHAAAAAAGRGHHDDDDEDGDGEETGRMVGFSLPHVESAPLLGLSIADETPLPREVTIGGASIPWGPFGVTANNSIAGSDVEAAAAVAAAAVNMSTLSMFHVDDAELRLEKTLQDAGLVDDEPSPAPARFIVLAHFAWLAVNNNAAWMNFAMLPKVTERFFGLSSSEINTLSAAYTVASIIAMPGIVWYIGRFGLKPTLLAATALDVVGSAMKLAVTNAHKPHEHALTLLVAQLLLGTSWAVIAMLPPLLAGVWFPKSQRTVACVAAATAMNIGAALGMLAPSRLVTPQDVGAAGWNRLFGVETLSCVLDAAMLVFFVPALPPHLEQASAAAAAESAAAAAAAAAGDVEVDDSASRAAAAEEDKTSPAQRTLAGLRAVAAERPPWLLLLAVAWSLAVGLVYTLQALLPQLVAPFGVADADAGSMGFWSIIVGSAASFAIGARVDKDRSYRAWLVALVGAGAVAYVLFASAMVWGAMPGHDMPMVLLMAVYTLVGIAQAAPIPLGLEYAVELGFPEADEATTGGLLILGSNIINVATTVALPELVGLGSSDKKFAKHHAHGSKYASAFHLEPQQYASLAFFAVFAGLNVAAAVMLWAIRGRLKRHEFERGRASLLQEAGDAEGVAELLAQAAAMAEEANASKSSHGSKISC